MSEAEFETIHMSPRVHTPPNRVCPAAFLQGLGLDHPPLPDIANALTDEATMTNEPSNPETQQPVAIMADENAEEAERLSRWLEKKEMEQQNKYNRTVTISPLPDTATVADVLPRIRGGVESCYVSKFEETQVAVVTFKLPADAITYAEFCAETPIWDLWTFEFSRPGVPFTWRRRAEVQLFKLAPGMGSAWERGDIPIAPRTVVLVGSRCLVYKDCKPHEVAGIYRALGLHKSQHQRDQVEGIWLDGPVRDHKGNPIHGNLHVWFTSIKLAQEAKARVPALDYEYDPCSDSPEKLLLYLDEGDEVPVFRHHEPFVNLLELHQKTMLTGISDGVVNPVYAYWHCRVPVPAVPDNITSLPERLRWALQSNAGPATMPAFQTTYQQPDVILPPATTSDPFLDFQPIARGFPPQPQNGGGTAAYTLGRLDPNLPINVQPFAAGRAVPAGYHLSPSETYVARTQERQALGYPPYHSTSQNELPYRPMQPSRSLTSGTTNSSSGTSGISGSTSGTSVTGNNAHGHTTNYSNLGGPNNPQSEPSTCTISSPALAAAHKVDRRNTSGSGDEVSTHDTSTDSGSTAEPTGVSLRGVMALKPDEHTSTDPRDSVCDLSSRPTPAPGKYSHKDLGTQDVFWTCSLEEFHAMNNTQWASFGTTFYVAPAGFDTATKHVVQLE